MSRVSAGPTALDLLTRGGITVKGRLPWSSNATFLVELTLEGETASAVYKPERGERPLWDFPPGLFKREIAAYHLSEALGWGLVPLTVEREGPFGAGSLQLFVPADFEQHYFTLVERAEHHPRLRLICAFDLLANNADRKSGHCLLGPDGAIHAIDNGLCFSAEPKLRTVIWDFAGQPVPPAILGDVGRLVDAELRPPLAVLLAPAEQEALLARGRTLIAEGRFPAQSGGRDYPWPLV
ncbi:MAG: SCO1664 family protein [Candidatus Rokubacteria bacterium]|nr:SCO1664 family protein [Candidatus Rokubacteria bacterium]